METMTACLLSGDIVMPPIGLVTGGVNFTDLKLTLKPAEIDALGKTVKAAVTVNYGNFLQTTLDFMIIAFAVFMMIKAMNTFKKKEEQKSSAPPAPTTEEILLTEIRDLLKAKK